MRRTPAVTSGEQEPAWGKALSSQSPRQEKPQPITGFLVISHQSFLQAAAGGGSAGFAQRWVPAVSYLPKETSKRGFGADRGGCCVAVWPLLVTTCLTLSHLLSVTAVNCFLEHLQSKTRSRNCLSVFLLSKQTNNRLRVLCLVKTSQLLILNSWVPGGPAPG